jgi:hypothetical protein
MRSEWSQHSVRIIPGFTPGTAIVLKRDEHVLAVLQKHFQILNPLTA